MDSAFEELSNLEVLYLNDNEIKTLDSRAFRNLWKLRELRLDNNKIFEISSVSSNMKSLTEDLGKNKLTTLATDAFRHLNNLEKLDLSLNPIESMEKNAFRGLGNLLELNMHNCRIQKIEFDNLRGLLELRKLDINNNMLTVFKTNVYARLPELRMLNLSSNKIRYVY